MRLKACTLMIIATSVTKLLFVASAVRLNSESYEWPEAAAKMLKERLQPSDHTYTEAQADEFMANAMAHYVRAAQRGPRRPELPATARRPSFGLLRTAAHLDHRKLVTQGIKQETGTVSGAQNWFSLPPLIDKDGNSFYELKLNNGEMGRSLDIIRFDVFKPKTSGFWIPTAIVRPFYLSSARKLHFRVVYEYPTSVNRYRDLIRDNPQLAADSLKQAIDAKQAKWLEHVLPGDRDIIARTWAEAPGSPYIPQSALFPKDVREAYTNRPVRYLPRGAAPPTTDLLEDLNQLSPEADEHPWWNDVEQHDRPGPSAAPAHFQPVQHAGGPWYGDYSQAWYSAQHGNPSTSAGPSNLRTLADLADLEAEGPPAASDTSSRTSHAK